MVGAIGWLRVAELPAPNAIVEQFFFGSATVESCGGKNAAIICAAGLWPIGVDRTFFVDEHWTTTVFVVAHQHVTGRQARCCEQKLFRYASQRCRFGRRNVDEVRGFTARIAGTA